LESAAAPIVIAARAAGGRIAAACAPGCPDLGVMLPTTPLHALLVDGVGAPLVVTSGNRAGEPLCRDGDEARVRLAGIADAFLDHDRAIVQPLDDSVLRVDDGHVTLLRRARGYSPLPLEVPLKADVPLVPTLACGGALKNAIALAAGDRVWLGPHLGDLDDLHAQARYAQGIDALQAMTGVVPERIAHDRHPDYPSTRYVATRVEPAVAVQHHHAHVAACMAEHGLDERVLGIAWDGSGDGGDGSVWGGEWLETDYTQCTRIAHLRPFRLAGAEAAIREPRRVALALLSGCGRLGAAAALGFDARTQANLGVLIERGFNAPSTSSVGRLFDGVSAVLGLCHESAFEGEAAMRLEWAARSADQSTQRAYPLPLDVTVSPWQLDWRPLLRDVIDDHAAGVAVATIALGFHHALADAALVVARRAERRVVCLGGGCFQNALLARLVRARLVAAGLRVYAPARVPPNDGGLALGQAVVAARQAEC
ncbi:MAG: Sua5/YciO/YrdC/YwlC family protein, partial [Gammaproteobacteria bacterium]